MFAWMVPRYINCQYLSWASHEAIKPMEICSILPSALSLSLIFIIKTAVTWPLMTQWVTLLLYYEICEESYYDYATIQFSDPTNFSHKVVLVEYHILNKIIFIKILNEILLFAMKWVIYILLHSPKNIL